MVITHFGEHCFRLQSGERSLLIDPTNNRLKADIVVRTVASGDFSAGAIPAAEVMFPGEYEVQGIEIAGTPLPGEASPKAVKTAYRVRWEDACFAILPPLAKIPDATLVEWLNEPDVVFLPLGDSGSITGDAAAKIVRQIEPAVVLPSAPKTPTEFLKSLGQKGETEEKLVFKKKDLAGKKNRVVLLRAKS